MTRMSNSVRALIVCYLTGCVSSHGQYTALPVPSAATAVAATSPTVSQETPAVPIDEYVTARMREMRIPGLALAVLKDGKLVKASGYGLANIETNTPATAATAFRVASLSKQFIATAIVLLVQEGKLGLDSKATQYLDGAPASWKDITIRQLLTHTSGLVRDPPDYHPYSEQAITEVIKAAYSLPLNAPPGERFLYSNIGYYLLAAAITKVSGEPWDVFISERLFAPARMTSTRTGSTRDLVPNRASGYQSTNKALVNAESWIAVRPSSAFISTAVDLAAWDAFIDVDDPLRPANRALMRTPARLNDGTPVGYGFGWYVDSLLGRTRIHHDGQYPGFRAAYERFEDDRLTVIVLANADMASLQSLAIKIAGYYAPTLTTPPFTLSAETATQTVADSSPVSIRLTARNDGKAAPNSLVEMEIWDATGKAIHKQHRSNESFDAGQTKSFTFSWTPTKPGTYSVNVGAYGPKWAVGYAWKENAATIIVR